MIIKKKNYNDINQTTLKKDDINQTVGHQFQKLLTYFLPSNLEKTCIVYVFLC
jgi:hypothetical protein